MTSNSELQVFRYQRLPYSWLKLPAEWWASLVFLGVLYFLHATRFISLHISYDWLMVGAIYSAYATWIYSWARKNGNGRLEVTAAALTRHFGDGTSMTLAWNDMIYFVEKLPLQNKQRLVITSEAGKHKFYIPDTVENFSELQNIIRSRATQYSKDVKREKIPVS